MSGEAENGPMKQSLAGSSEGPVSASAQPSSEPCWLPRMWHLVQSGAGEAQSCS